jgi:hypothetical protein
MHCNSRICLLTNKSFILKNKAGRSFIYTLCAFISNLQYDICIEHRVLKALNEVMAGYIVQSNGAPIEKFFDRSIDSLSDNKHLNSISYYGSKSEDIVPNKTAVEALMVHIDY